MNDKWWELLTNGVRLYIVARGGSYNGLCGNRVENIRKLMCSFKYLPRNIYSSVHIYIYVNKDIYIFLLCEIREPERNDIPVTTTQLVFGFWF